jgi:predicted alpha/beta hydrolase family esterase
MKQAVILHGTDGAPEHNWFPWLKGQLESRGYEVWIPELPNNHTPDRRAYNDFLFGSGWDFTDNLIIGHSSGASSILNLLEDDRSPHIQTGVLVSPWYDSEKANLPAAGFTLDQFTNLFPPNGFNFDLIKSKVDNVLVIHGANDPYCPLEQAEWLAAQTGSDLITIPNGFHLSQGAGFTELPQLTEALEQRRWL